MVNAVVLLNVEPSKVSEVAEALAAVDNVSEVYSVGGRYDIVVIIRARDNESLARTVTERFLKLGGIKSSETLIAFRAYSRHDLESLFSVGAD